MNQPMALFLNGRFFTMDRSVPRVEALLVRDGRVVALGPRDLVAREADSYTRRVDLDGQTVVPGFIDCHCHILTFGLTLDQVELGGEAVHSIADIQRAITQRAQQTTEGDWIVGRGYDQNKLQEGRHPTRQELDAVVQDHPVILWHVSGHALSCNSRALQLTGITANTPTPSGGDIERDPQGEPTGVLKEPPAMDLLTRSIPPPSVQQGTEAIIRAMDVMASQGITSAADAATGQTTPLAAVLQMYRNALNSGKLSGRITLMPTIQAVAPPDSEKAHGPEEFWAGNQPEWLRIGAAKIFVDGALTTRTAALREPYADDAGNTGLLIWEPNILTSMLRRAHRVGWQIAAHAIGDRAIETLLDCYEQVLSESPREDHRHRIEHCMMLDTDLALRIQRLGLVPTVQPAFISQLGDAYIAALGMERAAQLIPLQLFDLLAIPVAFSSDRPVIPGAPLRGVRAAMERTTPGGVRLGPQHTISALQAIRHYTAGSAYAEDTEEEKGTLHRGALADFTVLSGDPADTPPEDFAKIRVAMTVVGGEVTFGE